jgi:dynein light intermediate chain
MFDSASLVRYNNPVLVSTSKKEGGASAGKDGAKVKKALGKKQPPVEIPGAGGMGKELTQTEDILNSILPPK